MLFYQLTFTSYKMSGDEREDVPIGCFELERVVYPTNTFRLT